MVIPETVNAPTLSSTTLQSSRAGGFHSLSSPLANTASTYSAPKKSRTSRNVTSAGEYNSGKVLLIRLFFFFPFGTSGLAVEVLVLAVASTKRLLTGASSAGIISKSSVLAFLDGGEVDILTSLVCLKVRRSIGLYVCLSIYMQPVEDVSNQMIVVTI